MTNGKNFYVLELDSEGDPVHILGPGTHKQCQKKIKELVKDDGEEMDEDDDLDLEIEGKYGCEGSEHSYHIIKGLPLSTPIEDLDLAD